MENTNFFTIVMDNRGAAENLGKALGGGEDTETSGLDFLKNMKLDITLPEFDSYERNDQVINGCFTSGSTGINDFMIPLSRVSKYMYCEIIDDEISRSLKYGFIEGKRSSLEDTFGKMKELYKSSKLGRAGKTIEAQDRFNKDKSYALRVALINRMKISVVKDLLEQGANPNSRDSNGNSCLYHAIINKSSGIASLLLEHGADVNSKSCSKGGGSTYLYEACRFNAPKIVEELLNYGVDPNIRDGISRTLPIQMAIEEHMSKSVKQMIDHGVDLHINLLSYASEKFHYNNSGKINRKLEIFKLLLKDPELKKEFSANKTKYLIALNKNFKGMHPGKKHNKDIVDFDKMYKYLENKF